MHSISFEASLGSLRQVLKKKIRAVGLKLHPDKCHFMQREVQFLRHKVRREGISTMSEKGQAVTVWPIPSYQKQLKSFLACPFTTRGLFKVLPVVLLLCFSSSRKTEACMDRTVPVP